MKEIKYIIVDKHGNQLSSPSNDDDELWDRVEDRDPDGRRGLKVVAYRGDIEESVERKDSVRFRDAIMDALYYLIQSGAEYPENAQLFDSWEDWLDEYDYNEIKDDELCEDSVIIEDALNDIDDDGARDIYDTLVKLRHEYNNDSSMRVLEAKTSRIWQHLTQGDDWAIVSPYRSEYSEEENQHRMTKLKKAVRAAGYGFIQFVSRWVENGEAFDEESLMCMNMDEATAIKLGKQFEQSSVIVCKDGSVREICTTPFETYSDGETVRTFDLSGNTPMNIRDAEEIFAKRKGGPVSKPKRGRAKPFTLKEMYEIEEPRASYFQNKRKTLKILDCAE